MLGEMFYLFRKYGDAIAKSYKQDYGRLQIETDMSGIFRGYYRRDDSKDTNLSIFMFNNVKEAIKLFRKEIGRLRDGQ